MPLHTNRALSGINSWRAEKWLRAAGKAHYLVLLETHSDVECGGLEVKMAGSIDSGVLGLPKVSRIIFAPYLPCSVPVLQATRFILGGETPHFRQGDARCNARPHVTNVWPHVAEARPL